MNCIVSAVTVRASNVMISVTVGLSFYKHVITVYCNAFNQTNLGDGITRNFQERKNLPKTTLGRNRKVDAPQKAVIKNMFTYGLYISMNKRPISIFFYLKLVPFVGKLMAQVQN